MVHSALRFNPRKRNVLGIASPAPSGHRYLQNGRSMNSDRPSNVATNRGNGQVRLNRATILENKE